MTLVDDFYYPGVVALKASLDELNSKYPIVALCLPMSAEKRQDLIGRGIECLDCSVIENPYPDCAERFAKIYSKLHVFSMSQFDRVTFIDADMILLRNIDELFEIDVTFAAAPDHGFKRNEDRFNSGLFVVDPSRDLYEDMLEKLHTTDSYDKSDQGFLNMYFKSRWFKLDPKYNTLKRVFEVEPTSFDLSSISVLHYVGVKPWELNVDDYSIYENLNKLWFQYCPSSVLAESFRKSFNKGVEASTSIMQDQLQLIAKLEGKAAELEGKAAELEKEVSSSKHRCSVLSSKLRDKQAETLRLRSCTKYRIGKFVLAPYEFFAKRKFLGELISGRLRQAKCVILFDTIKRKNGGSERPLHYVLEESEFAEGSYYKEDLGLWRLLALRFYCRPRIVLNGISFLLNVKWSILLFGKNTYLYLHETDYVWQRVRKENPIYYFFVSKLLRRWKLLCVSEQQAEYVKNQFGVRHTDVIYNATKVSLDSKNQTELKDGLVHVVMVGSIQHRKGPGFFGDIADEFKKRNLPYQFHWVGRQPGNVTLDKPLSENVIWHGHLDNPAEVVSLCDIFFLSSVDDPFPLSVLEALILYKKTVVYRKVGSSEIIDSVDGCAVYDHYTVSEAMKAIELVNQSDVDEQKYLSINANITSVTSFTARVSRAVGCP